MHNELGRIHRSHLKIAVILSVVMESTPRVKLSEDSVSAPATPWMFLPSRRHDLAVDGIYHHGLLAYSNWVNRDPAAQSVYQMSGVGSRC